MKIETSQVDLKASHEASYSRKVEIDDSVSYREIFASLATPASDRQETAEQRVQRLLQALVEAILAALDGKKCTENIAACDTAPATEPTRAGREVHWEQRLVEQISESEKTTGCGAGCVQTADGRQIAFDFSLDMAREFTQTRSVHASGTTVLHDPLVLTFDGKAAELTTDRITFDLNADGSAEQIPGLGKGSGFLVFDRNGNGRADDGSELFGVASGNGFADLAQLDGDHNGWIDEGDAAFKRLSVWSGDAFQSLTARGIGALYTRGVEAPFALKAADNALLGEIRAAGLYLTEAGQTGHLQQVDLAVSVPSAGTQQPEQGQQLAA